MKPFKTTNEANKSGNLHAAIAAVKYNLTDFNL